MKNLKILFLTALTGIGVAITYFYFEYAVNHSINYIWEDSIDTDTNRLLLLPLCLILTFIYFGAQHILDPKSEEHESQGLGESPKPTVANFIKVLAIGFLSLVAGASLGPEAILVPACILLGSYLGVRLLDNTKSTARLFGVMGFIALLAAFFDSFIVGLLSLLLIKKQFKIKIGAELIILAVVASGSTVVALGFLDSSSFVGLPNYSWTLNIVSLFVLAILGLSGYFLTYVLKAAHDAGEAITKLTKKRKWWFHAFVAGFGLSLLYLLGGSLVQFTGNGSIKPMLEQSADLGFFGLAWILFIKVAAISWSKASGYRGGLVFPTVFVVSVLVAIAQLFTNEINLIYGLIAAMTGAIVADGKVKFLF